MKMLSFAGRIPSARQWAAFALMAGSGRRASRSAVVALAATLAVFMLIFSGATPLTADAVALAESDSPGGEVTADASRRSGTTSGNRPEPADRPGGSSNLDSEAGRPATSNADADADAADEPTDLSWLELDRDRLSHPFQPNLSAADRFKFGRPTPSAQPAREQTDISPQAAPLPTAAWLGFALLAGTGLVRLARKRRRLAG